MKHFRAYYFRFLEFNLYLISTLVISSTTQMILLCSSMTLEYKLINMQSHPLQKMNALTPGESNLTVPACIMGVSQVKNPLSCEIETNLQDNVVNGDFSINTTHKDDSKIHNFAKSDTLHRNASNIKTFDHSCVYDYPSPSIKPSKSEPMHLTKPATSSVSEPKLYLKTSTLDDLSETSPLKSASKNAPLCD